MTAKWPLMDRFWAPELAKQACSWAVNIGDWRCRLLRRMSPLVALFGHGAMSDLSPLSAVKRKLDFGAVRAPFSGILSSREARLLIQVNGQGGGEYPTSCFHTEWEDDMPESVYDVILLIGSSKESWEKAAANAVEQASKSLRNLRVAEIVELDMQLDAKGKVEAYRAKIRLSFKVER